MHTSCFVTTVYSVHIMLLIRLALPLVPWPYYDDLFGSSPPKRLVVCTRNSDVGGRREEGMGHFFPSPLSVHFRWQVVPTSSFVYVLIFCKQNLC